MYEKIYVGLIVEFLRDGGMRPRELLWHDGKRFIIDRVKFIEKAPCKTGGILTTRYTILIGGEERLLFYEKSKEKWFIERKKNENYTAQRLE